MRLQKRETGGSPRKAFPRLTTFDEMLNVIRAAEVSETLKPLTIEPGDIFACFGSEAMSRFISIETSLLTWPFAPRGLKLSPSHVAIACPQFHPNHTRCYWFESTTMTHRKCVVAGRPVSGVQCHAVGDRLHDYLINGAVELYRLTPINALSPEAIMDMRSDLSWFIDREVGYEMAGAIFSGARIIRGIDKLTGWMQPRMESVFCSQLIAAELMSICRMNRDNPQRYNPGRLLRVLVGQGTYTRIRALTVADLPEVSLL